jgi:VanZ family protein
MCKPVYGNKMFVLHAVLTVAAAVTIFVLSVMPPFYLSNVIPVNFALLPYISVYCALCLLAYMLLRVACATQFYKKGSRNKLFVLHAVLTVFAAVTILVLSVMPPLSLSSGTPANSGLVPHIIAYGTLCFLTCMWLRVADNSQSPELRAFVFTSLYGLFVECVQFCVPYRSFEMSDILINCLAAATAIIPCYAMIRLVPLYKKNKVQEATSRLN